MNCQKCNGKGKVTYQTADVTDHVRGFGSELIRRGGLVTDECRRCAGFGTEPTPHECEIIEFTLVHPDHFVWRRDAQGEPVKVYGVERHTFRILRRRDLAAMLRDGWVQV